MKGRFCFVFLSLALACTAAAQKTLVDALEHDIQGQGVVRVMRDVRLDSLIGVSFDATVNSQIKAVGYRIQVYSGNNTRDARNSANESAKLIGELFPDLPVYVTFRSPRWLCTAGDFLSYEEAYEVMRQIKKETQNKGLLILRNQEINIPIYE